MLQLWATRTLYLAEQTCPGCGVTFTVGYRVRSNHSESTDVCGPCIGKPKE